MRFLHSVCLLSLSLCMASGCGSAADRAAQNLLDAGGTAKQIGETEEGGVKDAEAAVLRFVGALAEYYRATENMSLEEQKAFNEKWGPKFREAGLEDQLPGADL